MLQLIYGIVLSPFAWLAMALADELRLDSRHWLRKKALIACCRVGGLGGGIDETSDALMEKWGKSVKPLLHEMRCKNEIPPSAKHAAYVHDTIDHGICEKWKNGVPANGVRHGFLTDVRITNGYYKDKQARLIGLHQSKPYPVFEARTHDNEWLLLQENEFTVEAEVA